MEWYLKAFRNYATFKGRARRKEYWMFQLFNLVVLILLASLDGFLGLKIGTYGIFYSLYLIAAFLPNLSIQVRRLHDIGRAGEWVLIGLIPIVNIIFFIVLIIWNMQDSKPGENRFGLYPKVSII